MKIITLVENTSLNNDFKSEHGLSLYIETNGHNFLFDLGETNLFAENAKKLGVDLKKADLAIISHGHYDHGGGIKFLLDINSNAKIYLNKNAFGLYYSKRKDGEIYYIGLNKSIKDNEQLVYVDGYLKIDNELEIFSCKDTIEKQDLETNKNLFMKDKNSFVKDKFFHEQNLIISTDNKYILVTGCSHNGIIKIIEQFKSMKKCFPDYVIGGFHLSMRNVNKEINFKQIDEVARYFQTNDSIYYTGHCTGLEPYNRLKLVLGDRINYLSTGSILNI